MRLLEIWDRDLAFAALKDEIKQLTATIRILRQKRAVKDVVKAEKRLIKAQVDAKLLNLPVRVFGTGQVQCKRKNVPYSMVKPAARSQCSKMPQMPA